VVDFRKMRVAAVFRRPPELTNKLQVAEAASLLHTLIGMVNIDNAHSNCTHQDYSRRLDANGPCQTER
jgi:hypothetical protein